MFAPVLRTSRMLQRTGLSFAVMGTVMHVLNMANLVTASVSHIWSAIAIGGFVITAGDMISRNFNTKKSAGERNDEAWQ